MEGIFGRQRVLAVQIANINDQVAAAISISPTTKYFGDIFDEEVENPEHDLSDGWNLCPGPRLARFPRIVMSTRFRREIFHMEGQASLSMTDHTDKSEHLLFLLKPPHSSSILQQSGLLQQSSCGPSSASASGT